MNRFYPRYIIPTIFILIFGTGCQAPDSKAPEAPEVEFSTEEVSDFMDSFHAALAAGDSVGVVSMFAEEVDIVEGGNVQSRLDYFSGHFRGDAGFLSALEREGLSFTARNRGNTVVVISTSRLTGMRGDRKINMISAETAVLGRRDDGWMIMSLHWSSGRR
jgi:ketosteroid isomerase-like protein